jgi:hypothetical protein
LVDGLDISVVPAEKAAGMTSGLVACLDISVEFAETAVVRVQIVSADAEMETFVALGVGIDLAKLDG